jgi:hypothetical protein
MLHSRIESLEADFGSEGLFAIFESLFECFLIPIKCNSNDSATLYHTSVVFDDVDMGMLLKQLNISISRCISSATSPLPRNVS